MPLRTRSWSPRLASAAITALLLGCGAPQGEVTEVHVAETKAPGAAATADPVAGDGNAEIAGEPRAVPAAKKPPPGEPPPAHPADADVDRAKELFKEGVAAYSSADYQNACLKFQAAYDLVPNNALLFNVASCELKMNHTAKACDLFHKYIAAGDPLDPRIQQVTQQAAQRCP